jgi:hypothetical protein
LFSTIANLHGRDRDFSERVFKLTLFQKILDGALYDVLPYEFWQSANDAGEPISISQRRPSVRYNLARLVVQDSVSMLFGDGRFPAIECADEATRDELARIVKGCGINALMLDAAFRGSIGSTAILARVLKGRLFCQRLDTIFLTPVWDPEAPDTLLRVTQRYKVKGVILRDQGYIIHPDRLNIDHWFMREWDADAETWYLPWTRDDEAQKNFTPQVDKDRTVRHALGLVPIVWIKNLSGGDEIDGACTFEQAIHTSIEIDYQLSQAGRGLKYSSDPELMLKDPATGDGGEILKGSGNAIVVSEKGDAKWLEISGDAVGAVIEYTRSLRELALESIRGNRSSADRITAAQSGRALELLHQALVWLAGDLRVSYGENGLLPLMRMIVAIANQVPITVEGIPLQPLSASAPLSLRWGPWFTPTENDKVEQANALKTNRDAGNLSRETAVRALAAAYELEDVEAELSRIAADEQEAMQRQLEMQAQAQVRLNGDAAA